MGGRSSKRAAGQQLQSDYFGLFGGRPSKRAAGQLLQSDCLRFFGLQAHYELRRLQGSNCDLTILGIFWAVGPARGLQGSNCNLTTLDCLVAGPVRKLEDSNCTLRT